MEKGEGFGKSEPIQRLAAQIIKREVDKKEKIHHDTV